MSRKTMPERILPAVVAARTRWRSWSMPAGRPSYFAKREELRRVRALSRDFGRDDPVFEVNDKLDGRAWAAELGVRHAALLARAPEARELPWSQLPERFVVKPARGSSSRGVHLLRRDGAAFRSITTGSPVTLDEVVADLRQLAALGKVSHEVLVEELVVDPNHPGTGPVDWKFSTFFGEVGVVEAKVAGPGGETRWGIFDATWSDLGHGWVDHHPLAEHLRPPLHATELLAAARHISASVPRPFLRVDLYDSADGPIFGEITPAPGGPVGFRRDLDERLGGMWEEAEARLLVRAANGGFITPATAPLPESAVRLPRGAGASSTTFARS